MKRWPIVTAAVVGAAIGFLSSMYVGMAIGLATSLTTAATVVVLIVCPVMFFAFLLRFPWWLVPILNGMFYGGVVFVIAKWRNTRMKSQVSRS